MTKELDKWEVLLIRAIKSNGDVLRRLRKIWHMRCGLSSNYECDYFIANALMIILEMREKGVIHNFDGWKIVIEALAPGDEWKWDYEPEDPYWEKVIAVLSSMIKLTAVKQWQGFRSPLRFRKAQ